MTISPEQTRPTNVKDVQPQSRASKITISPDQTRHTNNVGEDVQKALAKWAWSSDVLNGLLALAQARFEYHMIYIGMKN